MKRRLGISPATVYLCLAVAFVSTGCATVPVENESQQVIRVENQNRSGVRAYVALETSPTVRVLLGTIDAYESMEFQIPSTMRGHRRLVVYCEKGPRGRRVRPNEFFETALVSLPGFSIHVVRIRDPLRDSDYTVYSDD